MRSIQFAIADAISPTPIYFSIIGCLLLCLISSCSETKDKDNVLIGRWQVISAVRDGKLTKTLEDGFFDFTSDSSFTTNIYSAEQEFDYEITIDGFRQMGSNEVSFVIENQPFDTMVLSATIRDFEFFFMAVRDSSTTVSPELQ